MEEDDDDANVVHKKFLRLVTNDTLTWDNHTAQSISRLKSVCYSITALKATCQGKL